MSFYQRVKTEHVGAKNRGGYWGPRETAKYVSRKLRRSRDRKAARETLKCLRSPAS